MNNIKLFSILIVLAICIYLTTVYRSNKAVEQYRDPIWMNKTKLHDYYTRSNGSIYGSCGKNWDMFSGYPSYPKAY